MTKDIKTLIKDMQDVLRTGVGWTDAISRWVADDIAQSLNRQFNRNGRTGGGYLRFSNLGTPCERKLWYSTRGTIDPEPLPASTLNKFIFGDITESYILGLAKAAGHEVVGLQDSVEILGVRGSRDCIIDGMLIDVKSASSYAFNKFKSGGLRSDDSFGYISQISSYLYGSQSDKLLKEKTKAGFLVFDKQFGHLCLDIYDLTEELQGKEQEVQHKIDVVKSDNMPDRAFEPVPHNKSGNEKLGTNCSYCDFKRHCWPDLRAFAYSNGPVFFTKLVKEPQGNVMEIT